MKLYTENDLIDLVQSLKDYTHESHSILGHDERDAKEFVDIFLKDRTPIQLPSDEEIENNAHSDRQVDYWEHEQQIGFERGAKWMRDKIKNGDDLQYSKEEMYYIQNGFSGNAIIWWAKDSKGYTSNLKQAGKYTKEQAFNQVALNRGGEYAWSCSYVDSIENKPVCMFGSTLDISQRIDYKKIQAGQE